MVGRPIPKQRRNDKKKKITHTALEIIELI